MNANIQQAAQNPNPEQAAALAAVDAAEVAAYTAHRKRDAIELCGSPAWLAAHARATALYGDLDKAYRAAFACGAAYRPYWFGP